MNSSVSYLIWFQLNNLHFSTIICLKRFLTFSLSGLVFVGESHLQLQQPQLRFFLVCHPGR